jgi:hypothetical protein
MKHILTAVILLISPLIIDCEIIYHYVPHLFLKSCGQTCERAKYQCSDEMNTQMNCYKSAMSYCQVYLNLDTNEELRHHEAGCLVNCEKYLYYQNGFVDCDQGKSSSLAQEHRPATDGTIPICKCYSETSSNQKLMTPRLKLGLILLAISVVVYLFMEMCHTLTKGRSYIRSTFLLFISTLNLLIGIT